MNLYGRPWLSSVPSSVSRLHFIDSGILAKAFLSIVYYQSDSLEAIMRKDAFLKPLPFILVVMLCITSLIATVRAESWSWGKVENPAGEYLSVDMVNSNDGWAVGFDGAIIHWDGKSWNNVPSPTSYKLVSVDMVSSTEGWAIAQRIDGYQTNHSIIRWDGTSWNNVTSPTAAMLTSVDMVNSTDGWAVGYGGIIIRWNGTNWNLVESPINNPWESVDMVNSSDGWAVGRRAQYTGINSMIHWNGTIWNLVESPKIVGTRTLWSVDMVSSTDGWAVGDSGTIIRWAGTNWNNVTSPIPVTKHLFSVDMVNSTDGWAVGSDGCIIRWDGASWSNVTSPTGAWLYCVNMVSSTDGWIVGADGIYRWQEEVTGFPADYLIVVFAVVVVIAVVVWFFIRNRRAQTRTERAVPHNEVHEKKVVRVISPFW